MKLRFIPPFLVLLCMAGIACAQTASPSASAAVDIWPDGKMPGGGAREAEAEIPSKGDGFHRITNISHPTLTLFPSITNNGTMRFYGSPAFSSTGTFINNGVLDLINGARTLPANLQNNGVILQASDVRVLGASMSGGRVKVSVRCYSGHTYKLQTTTALTNPAWADVPGSVFTPATESVHDFTDLDPSGGQRFYRAVASP